MPWTQRFKLLGQIALGLLLAPIGLCLALIFLIVCAIAGCDLSAFERNYQCQK